MITIMDVFYILMILTIFGFIIHLETQMKVILEMLKQRWSYNSLEEDLKRKTMFEKSLDKLDPK
tara:strand:- start:3342 stop:3533 length:192 start_codon:yes stop_codon:yes gene_type:complete